MDLHELRTALAAARYQLSRTRQGSPQRYVLISLIRDYTYYIALAEVAA